jgi:hypothetical protein
MTPESSSQYVFGPDIEELRRERNLAPQFLMPPSDADYAKADEEIEEQDAEPWDGLS